MTNGLYQFINKKNEAMVNSIVSESTMHLWYERFGHLNYASLQHCANAQRVQGLPTFPTIRSVCGDCIAGRQHRERFSKISLHRTNEVLQVIHSDVVGPIHTPSLSGSQYFVAFIDDYSRKSFVYFMRHKSETFQKFLEFKAQVENETYFDIKI